MKVKFKIFLILQLNNIQLMLIQDAFLSLKMTEQKKLLYYNLGF